jgi:Holliday junction resolvase RusA-like endonuclease
VSAPIDLATMRDLLRRVVLGDHFEAAEVDAALAEPDEAPSLIITTSQAIEDAAINGRFVGRYRTSKRYGGFKENFAQRVRDQGAAPLLGPCFVSIAAAFQRTCDQDHNRGLPFGDVDSPVKCILDALKLGGAYIDDSQVCGLLVSKWPRPEQTIVEVTPC